MEGRQKFLIFLCVLGSCAPIFALLGSPEPLNDLNDPYVQKAAQFAVSEMSKRSNSLNKLVLVEVVGGSMQVVEGIKYSLNLKVGLATSCRNDGKVATLDECPVDPNSIGEWHVTVWMKPTYPPTYQLLNFNKVSQSEDEDLHESFPEMAKPVSKIHTYIEERMTL